METASRDEQPLLRTSRAGSMDAGAGEDGWDSDEEVLEDGDNTNTKPPPASSSTSLHSSWLPCLSPWLWGALGGLLVGCLGTAALGWGFSPSPSGGVYTSSIPRALNHSTPSPSVSTDQVHPGHQPRLEHRRQWKDQQLPLGWLHSLRTDPSAAFPELSSGQSPSPAIPSLTQFFANYTVFHAQSMRSPTPNTRYLVHRSSDYYLQGMGNRILGVVSGFLLAALTERVFIMDWSHSGDQFTLEDIFASPPIDWSYATLEQSYGKDELRKAIEGEQLTVTEHFNGVNDQRGYDELLCMSPEQPRWAQWKFLPLNTNQFFAPLLYHNRHFRSRLEQWGFTAGQLSVFLFHFLLQPSASVQVALDEFTAVQWKRYMVGVQIRTKDGHASSTELTQLAYQCAAVLTEALPREWRDRGEVGWYLATDSDSEVQRIGAQVTTNLSLASGAPIIPLSFMPCPPPPVLGSAQQAHVRCSVLHMFLLSLTDDMVMSRASTFGDVAHAMSMLSPMVLTEVGTCMRQPWPDPCFHHWHYVRRLPCYQEGGMVDVEDINGFCLGGNGQKERMAQQAADRARQAREQEEKEKAEKEKADKEKTAG